MTKKISIKEFTPELQRAINREVSSLKNSKRVLSKTELSDEAKAFLDKVVEGTWTQREDGKIDVQGKVKAFGNRMLHLFMGKEIFFGYVTRTFVCGSTKITSLEGAPEKVGESFYCNHTSITSLQGAPQVVGEYFDCSATNITSLEGAPEKVGGGFYCNDTKTLTSLQGAPKVVGGDFNCDDTNITSLEGSPAKVGGGFYCTNTKITSLDGIGEVKGSIMSSINVKAPIITPKVKAPVTESLTMSTTELPKFILQKAAAVQKINNKEALTETELEIQGTRDDIKVTLSKNNKARQIEHLQALKNQAAKLVALLKKEGIQDVSLEHVETLDMLRELEGSREEDDIIEQFAHVATEVYAIMNLPVNIATEINQKLLGIMQGREIDSFSDDTEYAFGDLDERAQEGKALLQISAYKAEFLVEEVDEEDED